MDEPEQLDLRAQGPRRRTMVGVLAVLLVLVVTMVVAGVAGPNLSSPVPTPAPTAPSTDQASSSVFPVDPPRTPTPLPAKLPRGTTRGRGPLAEDLPPGTLYLRNRTSVYAITPSTGSVTRTDKVVDQSDGAAVVSMVPTRTGVAVRFSDDIGAGVLIPDHGDPARLPERLGEADKLLPGPDHQVWVVSDDDQSATLVDDDGRAVGPPVRTTDGKLAPDGNGGLLLVDVGGVWQAYPGPVRKITPGSVSATGLHHYEVVECDDQHHCTVVLLSRDGAGRTALGSRRPSALWSGDISPDGTFAASNRFDDDNGGITTSVTRLIDGRTLCEVRAPDLYDSDTQQVMTWLDQRWVVLLDQDRLTLYDTTNQTATTPELPITGLIQLAWRPA